MTGIRTRCRAFIQQQVATTLVQAWHINNTLLIFSDSTILLIQCISVWVITLLIITSIFLFGGACLWECQDDGQSPQQHHITVLGFKGSVGMPDSYVGVPLKTISGELDIKTIPGKYRGGKGSMRDQQVPVCVTVWSWGLWEKDLLIFFLLSKRSR